MVMVGRYTNYLRRCRSSFIQCILDEVLFEILLRLPAQDIYFGARLVCHGLMVFLLTTIHLLLLYAIYVPDWAYWIPYDASSEVKCGVRGDTGPACNAVGMIDRMILGVNHLYRRPIYARTQG
ncbi:hypothetical protein OROHE_015037 [Orobanche hederae]